MWQCSPSIRVWHYSRPYFMMMKWILWIQLLYIWQHWNLEFLCYFLCLLAVSILSPNPGFTREVSCNIRESCFEKLSKWLWHNQLGRDIQKLVLKVHVCNKDVSFTLMASILGDGMVAHSKVPYGYFLQNEQTWSSMKTVSKLIQFLAWIIPKIWF